MCCCSDAVQLTCSLTVLSLCVLVCEVQIADFGLSQLVTPGEKMTKICGTWAYAAPEMSDPQAGGYDCKYDTWGFGVILFVVLSGYHPFDPEGGATRTRGIVYNIHIPSHINTSSAQYSCEVRVCVVVCAQIKARARAAVFDFEQPEWEVVSDLAKDLLKKLIVKNPVVRKAGNEVTRTIGFPGVADTMYGWVMLVSVNASGTVRQ